MSPEGQTAPALEPIPMPARMPVIGHLHQIPRDRVMQHMVRVARTHDGIYQLDFGGRVGIIVSHPDLVAELCDERRFRKVLGAGLRRARDFAGDGLFTAFSDEPNWNAAHRVLMPAFSVRAMRGYFPVMLEVAEQLVGKWRRTQGQDVVVADDMTRLTLDTISLAGFDYRFDSFAQPALHPFLASMTGALEEALAGLTRLPIVKNIPNPARERQYAADIQTMVDLVDTVIRERRAQPRESRDLLNLMLTAADPETGRPLDDVNIRYQIITFLIAGHETTSGLLTFATYLLLRHPAVLAQAYAEVDRVIGDRTPDYADLAQLTVIDRVLRETQRLWPTAPAITVGAYEDEVIGGRYAIPKDYPIVLLIAALHRDARAWPDPDAFDIDRWLPERESEHHPHAYKPFGNGVRACIGRQFALTEARLALAMILQTFALADPHDYKLVVKETLTLKPDDFRLRVRLRRPHERLWPSAAATPATAAPNAPAPQQRHARGTLAVLYGSSLGTCREIAEEIAERAGAAGLEATAAALDTIAQGPPDSGLLVVVTATYNGRAPDSAAKLEAALDTPAWTGLTRPDLRFAVMGCGNTEWRDTYQAFPKRIEAALAATGAAAITPRGAADANGDFDGALTEWQTRLLAALGDAAPAARPALSLRLVDAAGLRQAVLPEHATAFTVLANTELVRDAAGLWDHAREAPRGSVRHIVLRLPEGAAYQTGDHLAVFARNQPALVHAVLARLGVAPDQVVVLAGEGRALKHLPLGQPIAAGRLLGDFVELQDPATRADLATLAAACPCPQTRADLAGLADPARYRADVLEKRVTAFDLLQRFPAVEIPLEIFLELCAPARPRFYSISSSPLAAAGECTLTVGALEAPAWSGAGQYRGTASAYLMAVVPGDAVAGFLRRPNPPFAPPSDPARPIVLIGPGTGIAPFRGFLEERAALADRGAPIGPALLFTGARHPDHDALYAGELAGWKERGIVTLYPAFSSLEGHPHRFVQDALHAAVDDVWRALSNGAAVFVCGDGRLMAPAVRAALIAMYGQKAGASHEAASAWLEGMIEAGHYKQDVFGN